MLSKLFGLWSEYKYVVFAVLFVVVAATTWNISSKVSANEFNVERIRLLNKTIEAQKLNEELEGKITRSMLGALATARVEIQKSNQEAINEIFKDPRYRTCTVTDGVRNAYTNAIRAQSSSGKPAGAVPAPKGTAVR